MGDRRRLDEAARWEPARQVAGVVQDVERVVAVAHNQRRHRQTSKRFGVFG